jgi:hypothetical protein
MRVSQAIEQLESILEIEGDIEMERPDGLPFTKIAVVNVRIPKRHTVRRSRYISKDKQLEKKLIDKFKREGWDK